MKLAGGEAGAAPGDSRGEGWGMVLLFLLCFVCSYVDRQVISILVEPMKRDLGLSDLQVGLLQGFAFATCYAVVGIPLARALDRGNRVNIASGCVALWSVSTAGCAFVGSYGTLLATRAVTAVAEAGLPPAALSLIGDRFERRQIARVSALFMLGPYLGTGIALLGGGALLSFYEQSSGLRLPGGYLLAPWRAIFVTVAVPGLILAFCLLLFLRDPRSVKQAALEAGKSTALLPVLKERRRFLTLYLLGATLAVLVLFAQTAWLPTYFIRIHELPAADVGKMVGPIFLLGGIAGSLAAVWLSAGGGDEPLDLLLKLMIRASLVLVPSAIAVTLVPWILLSLAFFAVSVVAGSLIVALLPTPLQLIAPDGTKAQFITIGAFVLSIGAAGGGPFVVGLFSDLLFQDPRSIGSALALAGGTSALTGTILLRAARRNQPGRS